MLLLFLILREPAVVQVVILINLSFGIKRKILKDPWAFTAPLFSFIISCPQKSKEEEEEEEMDLNELFCSIDDFVKVLRSKNIEFSKTRSPRGVAPRMSFSDLR